MRKRVLVTGGAGFISSNFIRHLLANTGYQVVSLDALTLEARAWRRASPLLAFARTRRAIPYSHGKRLDGRSSQRRHATTNVSATASSASARLLVLRIA